MPELLIELFSEEIPARMQAFARDTLRKMITDGLVEAGLTYGHAQAFSTPRRLVLVLDGLSTESPTLREERKGPAVTAPEAAVQGFLRSTGLTLEQLEKRDDKKGQVYFAVIEKPGRAAPEIVAEVLEKTIRSFPWPKSMRWGNGTLKWVRPLHSILCLLSDDTGASVVDLDIDGIKAGATTAGHRFMAPDRFTVTGFADYAAKLKAAKVVLDSSEREAMIWHDATQLAFAQGLELVEDKGLLTEVAGLVEFPVALMGAIAEDFLHLPPEVLQTSMREHQKFFSVKNPKTGRIEGFVTVANRETADHGATILKGNLKVLSARLSDARFFWEHDLRVVKTEGLEGMGAGLANVTFHNKLGSQKARIERIAALAREIAPLVGADPDQAEKAALVVKSDLRSAMVGEFPELQGLMGSYYARAQGLSEEIAAACKGHYSPLGPSDAVPSEPVTVAVALADKIDTLTGFWAIDEKPTGSKDPFALRRAALGVIRLVLGNGLRMNICHHTLSGLVNSWQSRMIVLDKLRIENAFADAAEAAQGEGGMAAALQLLQARKLENKSFETIAEVDAALPLAEKGLRAFKAQWEDLLSFFHDRLKVFLKDEGIRHDVIDAVLAMPGNDDLTLVVKRAEALSAFLKTEDGTNLIQGFKRANNILTQAEAKDGVEYSFGADVKFAEVDAERALFAALDAAEAALAPAMASEDFATAMAEMAKLRAPIDAFFTAVQINAENPIVRRNRLNLLSRIRQICQSVADLTKLDG
ncbi:glycine--tRNA ligase subunit beta [Rhodobacter capsulatus]|uniref:Glycine--tRNA ligase beta subunit n=1 Tax=Rhodobacter capsulatus TaxID=1061 RepID=A0A1G7N432_RHOCA|nr:glycine--tRNA ligase subunit beta [Rhodobacter capsulatus]WER08255.1 glycine--tRNA ligase subunit beta [Rhodobacter capsulatus]SDF68808.1 glycyl-tRNA synthetase beta chain [Rhodobacter capsulatus]